MRCGNCCTRFGVCVTPFDIQRICKSTGMAASDFVAVIDDPHERERHEPAINISGRPSLLVLKWRKDRICMFYGTDKCLIYGARPMLCMTYPFVLTKHEVADIKGRVCPRAWKPTDHPRYLADLEQYHQEVERYAKIAAEWNHGKGGDLDSFLKFALSAAGPPEPPKEPPEPEPSEPEPSEEPPEPEEPEEPEQPL